MYNSRQIKKKKMHSINQLENNANSLRLYHIFKNCKFIINIKNQSIKISPSIFTYETYYPMHCTRKTSNHSISL